MAGKGIFMDASQRRIFALSTLTLALVTACIAGYAAFNASRYLTRGIERQAYVVVLDHAEKGLSRKLYNYVIRIDGRRTSVDLLEPLKTGTSVAVLVLPENPEAVVLGTRNSRLIEIFPQVVRGNEFLLLGFLLLLIGVTPMMLSILADPTKITLLDRIMPDKQSWIGRHNQQAVQQSRASSQTEKSD